MTAIASTNALEIQRSTAADPAHPPGTDIFTALLGTIAPAPSTDRAVGIGRKGASAAQQKRSPGDPLASINATDIAVAQLATWGPAKATVAAAEQESTSPRAADAPRPAARQARPAALPVQESAADQSQSKSPGPSTTATPSSGEPDPSTSGAHAHGGGHAPGAIARTHASATAIGMTAQVGSNSALTRAILPTAARGAERAQITPRAILRPVVAQHAQGRPAIKHANEPQTPARSQDPEADFASQLSRGFSAILRQNGGSLTLHLQPQDLGEMTIRMDLTPGKVAAAFEVESDQARQLLDRNLSTLRSALEARGLGVDSLTVNVSERSAQEALVARAEPETSHGGADPDGGASGRNRDAGMDRPGAEVEIARSAAESFPEAGATGVDTGGAQVIRLALDAVA